MADPDIDIHEMKGDELEDQAQPEWIPPGRKPSGPASRGWVRMAELLVPPAGPRASELNAAIKGPPGPPRYVWGPQGNISPYTPLAWNAQRFRRLQAEATRRCASFP